MTDSPYPRAGPISFSDPVARRHLITNGRVLTFRRRERTVGPTHARWEYHDTARADVTVTHVGFCHPTADDPTFAGGLPESGFETLDQWRSAIARLNGNADRCPPAGQLYAVTLRSLRAGWKDGLDDFEIERTAVSLPAAESTADD